MRVQFCGADRTVTGSCHIVEIGSVRLALDLGMYQGPRAEAERLNRALPEGLAALDAIILSHGHLDHCGRLPLAVRGGFKGPIYCTPATAEVSRIVLADSAEIQVEDARYLNKRSRRPDEPPVEPLYRPPDVAGVLRLFRKTPYQQTVQIAPGVQFTFFDAGHILGSAYVLLEWEEGGQPRRLLFTADVGRYHTPILRDPHPLPGPVDHLITESTYGDKVHEPMDQVGPQLLDAVSACIQRGGRLILPAFAIGRTQTLLWYVQKFVSEGTIPSIPIFVDSPMGVQATEAYRAFPADYDQETSELIGKKDLFGLGRITFAASPEQSRKINDQRGPCVIIASSPTCEFGRVLHHLSRSVEEPNDMVVFTGWIPPGTLGRRIQEGARRVRIYDRWYDLRCQVRTIHGLSAHADGDELLKFLGPTLGPWTTAHVVHGEVDQVEAFAQRLVAAGIGQVQAPALNSSIIAYATTTRDKRSAPARDEGE